MEQLPLEIIAIAALILLNGFFAGAEIAIVSVRKSKIQQWINKGSKSAHQIARFLESPETFLAAIQVGVTIAGTTASVIAGNSIVPAVAPALEKWGLKPEGAENLAIALVILVLSYLSLVVGELIPKYLAYAFPEKLALFSAPALSIFARVAYVPVKLLSLSVRILLKPFGVVDREAGSAISKEEINLILSEGHKMGEIDKEERELIQGVFEFSDTTVRQAMTPRTAIVGIDLTLDHDQILKVITEEGYSRVPVFERSLDNIIGVVHTKDIITLVVHDKIIILQDLIRPVSFIPDSKMISAQLRDFQRTHQHMAIVLDEYGGTAGLITLEDILEEIVGEIRDEHDAEQESFILVSEGVCLVRAQYPIEDFNKHFGVDLDTEGLADTIGGLVFERLGKLPEKGEKTIIDNLEFETVSLSGPSIDKMRVVKLTSDE